MNSNEKAAELLKFPYPYEAGLTVASDIDSANVNRFLAIHTLFCSSKVIEPNSLYWEILGLSKDSLWYNDSLGGIQGLGLELSDTFFLVATAQTMGMYQYDPASDCFKEAVIDECNVFEAIKSWLKKGDVEAFHGLLHYTREQVAPLLVDFYHWCEQERVTKPMIWINHSVEDCPTGLCPDKLRPNRFQWFFKRLARAAVGPLFGKERRPVSLRVPWYWGDSPGSKYYINDILSNNGLRYVWLNAGNAAIPNRIVLPERKFGDRSSILDIVTMDDGVKYYSFPRCYGKINAPPGARASLRQSKDAFDTSVIFTEENLGTLCQQNGTCILYTHWTHWRAVPIQDETISHFRLIRDYRDAGRIWVTTLVKLLEWTRIRTFLQYRSWHEGENLVIDIGCVDDLVVGRETLQLAQCEGLAFRVPSATKNIIICLAGNPLSENVVHRDRTICWIKT